METQLEQAIIKELKEYTLNDRQIAIYLPSIMHELHYQIATQASRVLDHITAYNGFMPPLQKKSISNAKHLTY